MIDIWLCWFVGLVLIIVGLLTAVYLIYLQMRRGATGLSVLSTSDTLALTVIGVMFIVNGLNTSPFLTDSTYHNDTLVSGEQRELNEVLNEECDFRKILMGYGLFLAPFLNAFISMLAHAVECYHDIVKKALETNVAQTKPSGTENISNTEEELSISNEIPRSKSLGSGNLHLKVPTLISELELVKQHVTEIAIEQTLSTSTNEMDNSQPSSSKTVQDMDVFQVSNLPKRKVSSPVGLQEGQKLAKTNENSFTPTQIKHLSRADIRNCRRLGVSLLGQWLLPTVAILILLTSNMEEHSFDIASRIDESVCYVDNIASVLRISPECIEQLRQESYIKTLLSKPMQVRDNTQIINRYSLDQRNKTGQTDRMTSMIIRQIYSHVDEFNKTRSSKIKRLKQPRVSNLRRRNLRRNTGLHNVTTPHFRTLVKPNYDINLTREPTTVKNQGVVNKKDGVSENVDASTGYYDELPADYEENEDENGSEGVSGEAMSEEVTKKPSAPTKLNVDKEENEKIIYDEVVSEEGMEPAADVSESSLKPVVTTQNPQALGVPTKPDNDSEDTPDEEGPEEGTESTPRPFPRPTLRPTAISQEFSTPSSTMLDSFFEGYPTSLRKNNTLDGYLVQTIEEFSNIKICVKKCSISSNFMKGYLFAVLFLGYFIPITFAVVIYVVIIKNVSTISSHQISKKTDSYDKEEKETCTDMSCLAEIVKQFILISIFMWTPTFLETLLRTWFCVRSPNWVTMILFVLGQVHGIVRNFFNMKLVKANTKGQIYKGLFSGVMRRNDSIVHPSLGGNDGCSLKPKKLFMKSEIFGKKHVTPKN